MSTEPAAIPYAQQFMRSGQPRNVDNEHRHASGGALPVRVSAFRLELPTRVLWNVQVQDRRVVLDAVHESVSSAVVAIERALSARDPYTSHHQRRVAHLAVTIARVLELDKGVVEGLGIAAGLHDIGKIGLPSEILNFPGRLSLPAMELIRTHCQVGHDMIETIPFVHPVARIVLEHHERLDGSGYPNGRNADEVLPESKILAVADVAEAMTAHRPYRPARTVQAAVSELEGGAGRIYEPDAVAVCVELLCGDEFEFPGPALG